MTMVYNDPRMGYARGPNPLPFGQPGAPGMWPGHLPGIPSGPINVPQVSGPVGPTQWGNILLDVTGGSRGQPQFGGGGARRPGFGDLTGLDWTMIGAQALGAGLNWWERRALRKQREKEARELLEEERRQFDLTMDERQSQRDSYATNFARALEALYG